MEIDEGVRKITELFQKINEEVPQKTKEALDEIGMLDSLAKKQSDEVQSLKVQFLANFDKMTTAQKSDAFAYLQIQMEKMLKYSDKKIEISRGMTSSLTEMADQFEAASSNFIENFPSRRPETPKTSSHRKKIPVTEEKKRGRKKKEVKQEDGIKQEEMDLDEEIPNEMLDEDDEDRTWCWCQLLKQDEMVCCENPGCKYQWFHFKCIGMVTAPVGDWYCTTDCRNQALREKKERKTSRSSGGGGGSVTPSSSSSSSRRGIKKRK